MSHLTQSQLIRIFREYAGQKIYISPDRFEILAGVFADAGNGLVIINNMDREVLQLHRCKLLLKTLQEITDTDAFELAKIILKQFDILGSLMNHELKYKVRREPTEAGNSFVKVELQSEGIKGTFGVIINPDCISLNFVGEFGKHLNNISFPTGAQFEASDFLKSRGYALPLFIEPQHPDNGKTAIRMGIARSISGFDTRTQDLIEKMTAVTEHTHKALRDISSLALKAEDELTPDSMSLLLSKENLINATNQVYNRKNERFELNDLLLGFFKSTTRPVLLHEILVFVESKAAHLIPNQIIDVRSYISRRLEGLCKEGHLQQIHKNNSSRKFYACKRA